MEKVQTVSVCFLAIRTPRSSVTLRYNNQQRDAIDFRRTRWGVSQRERERVSQRERERESHRDSLILYLEDDGFRPWSNLPTGPR